MSGVFLIIHSWVRKRVFEGWKASFLRGIGAVNGRMVVRKLGADSRK
jgi:hypothetical protein